MSDPLETLLTRPLAEIADDGFARRVALEIMRRRARTERTLGIAAALIVALVCGAMPYTDFGQAVDRAAIEFGDHLTAVLTGQLSLQFALAAGSLVALWIGGQLFGGLFGRPPI